MPDTKRTPLLKEMSKPLSVISELAPPPSERHGEKTGLVNLAEPRTGFYRVVRTGANFLLLLYA